MKNLREIDQRLLEFKEKAELMVDLAYSSLLYDNRVIAREVDIMENQMDREHDALERLAVEEVREGGNVDRAVIYIRLVNALETIGDAAREIADIALRNMDVHQVFQLSVRDSDRTITAAIITENSEFAGKTLKELGVPKEYGMWVIAIKRGKGWIYGPDGDAEIKSGDWLIAGGPPEMEEEFVKAAGQKVEWDTDED